MVYPLILAALLAAIFYGLFTTIPAVQANGHLLIQYEWITSLEMPLSFRLDGLSLTFALLISGIGVLIFIYASRYMVTYKRTGYFFTVLFLFALSMLGLVLADHFLLLFIFWELTSITSYLLIGFKNESPISRRNALQALLVTASGGLVLFAGLVWLGVATENYSLSTLLTNPEAALAHPYATAIFLCLLVGCITKSAQVPFHFWLPNAMAAPTPVSAYLHSATMVKAGIYLLARLQPVFGDLEMWTPLLATLGGATALWSSMLSVTQRDLKQLLAYTTLMALGTLTFLLAFPTQAMAVAAMVFLVVHALYKACLFMVVGIVDIITGTRDRHELSGLRSRMKHVWVIALLAGLSMAGIPLFFGFIAKEMQYAAALELAANGTAVMVLIAANALMICAAYLVVVLPFRGEVSEKGQAHDGKVALLLWLPPALLAGLSLLYGMFPAKAYFPLIELAANSVAGQETAADPALWHGVNNPLLLSIITFCVGGLFILKFPLVENWCSTITRRIGKAETLYFAKLHYTKRFAIAVTRLMHGGSLTHYLKIMIAFIFGTLLFVILSHYSLASLIPPMPLAIDWIGVALSVLAVFGAFYAVHATTKIMALASLGASGFAMAGIFLLYGALDVAMTQLLVETLFVILAAALLWRIPEASISARCHPDARKVNMALALLAGISVTLVVWVVLQQPLDMSLSYFFENASYTMAHGRNIVNVILVDFRAFDTFGEITVVAVAAFGLWTLTRHVEIISKEPRA